VKFVENAANARFHPDDNLTLISWLAKKDVVVKEIKISINKARSDMVGSIRAELSSTIFHTVESGWSQIQVGIFRRKWSRKRSVESECWRVSKTFVTPSNFALVLLVLDHWKVGDAWALREKYDDYKEKLVRRQGVPRPRSSKQSRCFLLISTVNFFLGFSACIGEILTRWNWPTLLLGPSEGYCSLLFRWNRSGDRQIDSTRSIFPNIQNPSGGRRINITFWSWMDEK